MPPPKLYQHHLHSFSRISTKRLIHAVSVDVPDLLHTPNLEAITVTPPISGWPSRLSPRRLVRMITRQQNIDLALQMFDYAGKYHKGFSHTPDTYSAVIERLARAREFDAMESLFQQMQSDGVRCGDLAFIIAIRNYGFANRPLPAVRCFLRMPAFGVGRSVRSFNTLLNAMVQTKRFDLAHFLYKNARKLGIVPNVFSCNILIKALCKINDVAAALKVMEEMPEQGFVPNPVTYTTVLGGLCAAGDLRKAREIFNEIHGKGWVLDTISYTVLIDGYCRNGRLMDGVKLMDDMEENGVLPNDVTYSVVLEALCREEKSGEALNLMNDMIEKRFLPSSSICCKVMDLLCREGKVGEASSLWKGLLKNNCTPDNAISSTLIYWLCKHGKHGEAKSLFDEFERRSIPNIITYNALISGMCENGELQEAGKLWDDMIDKGCAPNVHTCNTLIGGFCKSGRADEGVKVFEEMIEKECTPNKFTFDVLIDGLLERGMEERITDVLMAILSRGILLDIDSWRAFVTKVVDGSEDQRHTLDGNQHDKRGKSGENCPIGKNEKGGDAKRGSFCMHKEDGTKEINESLNKTKKSFSHREERGASVVRGQTTSTRVTRQKMKEREY